MCTRMHVYYLRSVHNAYTHTGSRGEGEVSRVKGYEPIARVRMTHVRRTSSTFLYASIGCHD